MNPDQERLIRIGNGKAAQIVYENCVTFIRQSHDKHLKKLKVLFKDGKTDHVTLSSEVSAMCALDQLESDLLREMKLGQSAHAEMTSARKE